MNLTPESENNLEKKDALEHAEIVFLNTRIFFCYSHVSLENTPPSIFVDVI